MKFFFATTITTVVEQKTNKLKVLLYAVQCHMNFLYHNYSNRHSIVDSNQIVKLCVRFKAGITHARPYSIILNYNFPHLYIFKFIKTCK